MMIEDTKEDNMDGMQTDTMSIDTTTVPLDTIANPDINPCSEDSIYFSNQILPILLSSCALSGCHNAASAQDDVVLTSYSSLIGSDIVVPFNLSESDLYEVLIEDNEDKRMPQAPAARLNENQINLIATWISQGAKDLTCDSQVEECQSAGTTYTNTVKSLIDNTCVGCHSGTSPSGGINLNGYANLKIQVDNGKFWGAISWADGYNNMPQGGTKLDDCTLAKIKNWIDNGAPNN
jgi:mono/diheme cytochrome c family protein